MGLISKLLGQASDLTSDQARQELDGVLLPDEPVEVAFKVVRDLFVFTDRRLVLVNKQSLTVARSNTSSFLPSHYFSLDRERRDLRHGLRP